MRVAILGIKTLPAFAGADRVVERLLENLPAGYDVTVYLARNAAPRLASTSNRHYVYLPALRGKHLRALSFFSLCSVHFLVRGSADVAHVHNSDFGLFCPVLKLKRGIRLVGTFHGNPYERDKWGAGAKAFLRLSEWFFVRSCDVLTSVSASKTVDGRLVRHIPNGVERWTPSAPTAFGYEQLGLREGEYVMFACGRLDATKGLHHLLRAYRNVAGRRKLLVIGDFSHDSPYSASIEREAALDDRVVLLKRLLDRNTLFEVISKCSVFVFPSEIEAMSMTLLEAVGCRKLVVCSDIPENVAVVGDDYPFLFRSGDPSSLEQVLMRALIDPSGEERSLSPLFDHRIATFRWDAIVRQYEDAYSSATDLTGTGLPPFSMRKRGIRRAAITAARFPRRVLRTFFGFDAWHISPAWARPYVRDIATYLNERPQEDRESAVEIGSGLGDILRGLHYRQRLGLDNERAVVRAARFLAQLRRDGTRFSEFQFPVDRIAGRHDAIILVNWIHSTPPDVLQANLEDLFTNHLKRRGALIVDTVDHPGYLFRHSIEALSAGLPAETKTIGTYPDGRSVFALEKQPDRDIDPAPRNPGTE